MALASEAPQEEFGWMKVFEKKIFPGDCTKVLSIRSAAARRGEVWCQNV